MASLAFLLLLAFGVLAAGMFWPAMYATALRQMFRAYPDARDAFVGRGVWISFSRRFERTYALGALVLGFAWVFVAAALFRDTTVGAWLIFAPAILLVALAVSLAALVVCRWAVDE